MISVQHVSTYFPGFHWLGLLVPHKTQFTAMLSSWNADTSKHSSRFSPSVRKNQPVWERHTRLRLNTSGEWQKCWSQAELLVHSLAGFRGGYSIAYYVRMCDHCLFHSCLWNSYAVCWGRLPGKVQVSSILRDHGVSPCFFSGLRHKRGRPVSMSMWGLTITFF